MHMEGMHTWTLDISNACDPGDTSCTIAWQHAGTGCTKFKNNLSKKYDNGRGIVKYDVRNTTLAPT